MTTTQYSSRSSEDLKVQQLAFSNNGRFISSFVGFTLVELLVVISVILILASLIFPVAKAVNKAKIVNRTKGDLTMLETAIEEYKAKFGHYPPDSGMATTNQLYYELVGTTNDTQANLCRTLDGNSSLKSASISAFFGGKVGGFVNCTRSGGGDEGVVAQKVMAQIKPSMIADLPGQVNGDTAKILVGLPWTAGPPPFDLPVVAGTTLNPWRYNSSNPTNNPNSYDLWIDISIGSQPYRFCNWSPQPLKVTTR
jgi:prepilin-type N-terminal cleavage/methylation domain-containing protein